MSNAVDPLPVLGVQCKAVPAWIEGADAENNHDINTQYDTDSCTALWLFCSGSLSLAGRQRSLCKHPVREKQ